MRIFNHSSQPFWKLFFFHWFMNESCYVFVANFVLKAANLNQFLPLPAGAVICSYSCLRVYFKKHYFSSHVMFKFAPYFFWFTCWCQNQWFRSVLVTKSCKSKSSVWLCTGTSWTERIIKESPIHSHIYIHICNANKFANSDEGHALSRVSHLHNKTNWWPTDCGWINNSKAATLLSFDNDWCSLTWRFIYSFICGALIADWLCVCAALAN